MTHSDHTDPLLEKLLHSGDMSILLVARILDLINSSGATQLEIFSALGAVRELVPSLPISLVPQPEPRVELPPFADC
jgi:hypothetical protein